MGFQELPRKPTTNDHRKKAIRPFSENDLDELALGRKRS